MDCNNCNKVVPYIVHEADMSRLERTIHRMWILLLVMLILLVGSNVAWMVYEKQYETTTTNTNTEDVSQYNAAHEQASQDGC